jgi:hypothetical protein
MAKLPEQRLWNLTQVKLLEKQKHFRTTSFVADRKHNLFDMMIDIAEQNI